MKLYVQKVPDKKWAIRWMGCTEKQGRRFCKKYDFQYVDVYNTTLCFSTSIGKNIAIQKGNWIALNGDGQLTIYTNKKFKKDYRVL